MKGINSQIQEGQKNSKKIYANYPQMDILLMFLKKKTKKASYKRYTTFIGARIKLSSQFLIQKIEIKST